MQSWDVRGAYMPRATRIPHALHVNFGRPGFQYDTFDLDRLPSASVVGESQTWAPLDDAPGCGCPARSEGGAGMHRSEAEGRFGEAEPEGSASVCAEPL